MINEWKLTALIMDRLLFWLFSSLTVLSTAFRLIIIPCLKNAGYIPALAKDLTIYFNKSTQSLANVIEEQLRTNFTGSTTGEK